MKIIEKEINKNITRIILIEISNKQKKRLNLWYIRDLLIKKNIYFDYIILQRRENYSKGENVFLYDNDFKQLNRIKSNWYDMCIYEYQKTDEYKQRLRRKKLERIVC